MGLCLCISMLLLAVLPYLSRRQHPLSLRGLILTCCLLISLIIGCVRRVFLSYLLFLVYVGALLVVFAFSSVLTSEPLFKRERGVWGVLGVFSGLLGGLYGFYWCFYSGGRILIGIIIREPYADRPLLLKRGGSLFALVWLVLIMFVAIVSCTKLCLREKGAIR